MGGGEHRPIRRTTPFFGGGNALHIDGGVFGVVPNGTVPMLDSTGDCSASMDAAPWLNVNVSVQELTWKLVGVGFLNASDVAGSKLTGGLLTVWKPGASTGRLQTFATAWFGPRLTPQPQQQPQRSLNQRLLSQPQPRGFDQGFMFGIVENPVVIERQFSAQCTAHSAKPSLNDGFVSNIMNTVYHASA